MQTLLLKHKHLLICLMAFFLLLPLSGCSKNKFFSSIGFGPKAEESVESLAMQGLDYYGLENFEVGVSYFNKLLNIDKENGEWYLYRGIYYYQKNDLKDAKTQFNHALVLDAGLTESQYYLGKIYLANRDEKTALETFNLYLRESVDSVRIDEVRELISTMNKK